MKILIDVSVPNVGGGVEIAASLVERTLSYEDIEFSYLCNREVHSVITFRGLQLPALRTLVVNKIRPFRLRERTAVKEFECKVDPDLVFTLFGPNYVSFHRLHVMGLANAWLVHPTKEAIQTLPALQRYKSWLYRRFRRYWAKKADWFYTETVYSKNKTAEALGILPERIKVIPNVQPRPAFAQVEPNGNLRTEDQVIAVVSAYYPHKNLISIPTVAHQLLNLGVQDFSFSITLEHHHPEAQRIMRLARQLGVVDCLQFVGKLETNALLDLYRRASVSFLPSFLETSAAIFPESYTFGIPVVATDYPFNREPGGTAALYYPAADDRAAARQIAKILRDPDLRRAIAQRQREILQAAWESGDRLDAMLSWLRLLCQEKP